MSNSNTTINEVLSAIIKAENLITDKLSGYASNKNPSITGTLNVMDGGINAYLNISGARFWSTTLNKYIDEISGEIKGKYLETVDPSGRGTLTIDNITVKNQIDGYYKSTKVDELLETTLDTAKDYSNSLCASLSTTVDYRLSQIDPGATKQYIDEVSSALSAAASTYTNIVSGELSTIMDRKDLGVAITIKNHIKDNFLSAHNPSGTGTLEIENIKVEDGTISGYRFWSVSQQAYIGEGGITESDPVYAAQSGQFMLNWNPSGNGTLTIDGIYLSSNILDKYNVTKQLEFDLNKNENASELFFGTKDDVSFHPDIKPKHIHINIGVQNYITGLVGTAIGNTNTVNGNYATAFGNSTKAIGATCFAQGDHTIATGEKSHAEGYYTSACVRTSHAEGNYTLASAAYAHAEGNYTKAYNAGAHAEGSYTSAAAANSHTEGLKTMTKVEGSHAEGELTQTNAKYSHAEGYNTVIAANADYAHAEGKNTKAAGTWSHAEGESTAANHIGAHAEGLSTIAGGTFSHTEGLGTAVTGGVNYQHVEGKYNIIDKNNIYQHIVGAGTDNEHRINIQTLDWKGNEWNKGSVTASAFYLKDGTEIKPGVDGNFLSSTNPSATGNFELYNGNFIISSKYNDQCILNINPNAKNNIAIVYANESAAYKSKVQIDGSNNLIIGINGPGETDNLIVSDTAKYGLLNGESCTLNGYAAHAEGIDAEANGNYSHAEGIGAEANGNYSHAEGSASKATGMGSHAEGGYTEANGESSHAEGSASKATGMGSHAEGGYTEANGESSHAEGESNIIFNIGTGSHAEGKQTMISGRYAHTEGYNTINKGDFCHSEGVGTIVSYSLVTMNKDEYKAKPQHVEGRYNIEDINNQYQHIVGNGIISTVIGNIKVSEFFTNERPASTWVIAKTEIKNNIEYVKEAIKRNNIQTLDWEGNEWLSGNISAANFVTIGSLKSQDNRINTLSITNPTNTVNAGETHAYNLNKPGVYYLNITKTLENPDMERVVFNLINPSGDDLNYLFQIRLQFKVDIAEGCIVEINGENASCIPHWVDNEVPGSLGLGKRIYFIVAEYNPLLGKYRLSMEEDPISFE